MEQQNIREYNDQTYSIPEGAALIEELNKRTEHDDVDYNSIAQLGTILKALVNNSGYYSFACSDEISDLEASSTTPVYSQIMLQPIPQVKEIRFSVTTAPTGSDIIIDVKKNGTSIYSVLPRIEAGELSTLTQDTPQDLDGTIAFDPLDKIEVFITQVGDTAPGKNLKAAIRYAQI
jgi:hypothetical protein